MESSYRTRILVSPSLSASFPFTNGVAQHGLDCGEFIPFPSLLHEQTGSSSAAIKFPGSDLLFHPFMMIEQPDLDSRSLLQTPISFKIDSTGFFQLPNLLSFELPQNHDPFTERLISSRNPIDDGSIISKSTPIKRSRLCSQYLRPPALLSPPAPYHQLVESRKSTDYYHTPSPRSTDRSRQRRQLISDRTRILEKLMPWERRMDTGSMLEEASKYIKFLEAQVTALESMPAKSGFTPSTSPPKNVFGMERLTRQQLLQVMVNSSIIQDMLYKKGFCIVSVEQVKLLRQAKERRMQPLLLLGNLGGE